MIKTEIFSIGEIPISLSWDTDKFHINLSPVFTEFSASSNDNKRDNISFAVNGFNRVDFVPYTEIFNTLPDGLWKMWKGKNGDKYLLSLHRIASDNSPYRFATANNNFSDFQIFNDLRQSEFNPFEYPLDELAISGYLNINRIGILLHSAMFTMNGNGYLFSGTSGAGKSTLSELWLQDTDSEVLTDDRVIIREKRGMLYAYGTPWHGTASIHKNKGVPPHQIFFITHGNKNAIRKLSVIEASNRLMVRCFPTFWHKDGMQFALDFCTRIASEIECCEFSFVPDTTAIEFVKDWIT